MPVLSCPDRAILQPLIEGMRNPSQCIACRVRKLCFLLSVLCSSTRRGLDDKCHIAPMSADIALVYASVGED